METHEKLRYRAWLLAIGADRWYECVDRVERMRIVEILEEEFARAKAAGEPLEKERAFLHKHGIVISDVPVQVETPTYLEEEHNVDLVQGKRECRMQKNAETQALPAHHAAALDAQEQQNSSTSQAEGMSGTTPVHHSAFSKPKVQQNPEHDQREALSMRMTG